LFVSATILVNKVEYIKKKATYVVRWLRSCHQNGRKSTANKINALPYTRD